MIIQKASAWLSICLSILIFMGSSASATERSLPAHISTGKQYGVISRSPTANQLAFHWLKQGGTVWDALVAVLFEMLLDAPHIVSFDSDVSMLVVKRGSAPKLYWLANFEDPAIQNTRFFPSSIWPQKLLALYDQFHKFTLDQLLTLSIHKANQGWQIPKTFRPELDDLGKVPFLKEKAKQPRSKSPTLAKQLQNITRRTFWFFLDNDAQQKILEEKQKRLTPAWARKLKHTLTLPGKASWTFQSQIPLGPAHLYGANSEFLKMIQTRLDLLKPLTNPLEVKQQTTYLTQIEQTDIDSPYKHIFSMVVFDQYGQAVALNIGIPHILKSYVDKQTDTLAHNIFTDLKERFWILSPYCIWEQKRGILALIAPHVKKPDSFLTSFPIMLDILKQQKHQFVELLDTPQFHKASKSKLYTTHASKGYLEAFSTIRFFDPPTLYIGLEVLANSIIGFTSKEITALPLMH